MMRYFTKTAILVGIILSGSAATAQSLRNADEPAEFPPASFKGKQFVDSRGCVYVRAGFDGAVTWVPRVNRSRDVICGFQPTFANAAPEPLPVVPDPEGTPAPGTTTVATATPPSTPARVAPPAAPTRPPVSARPAPPPTTTSTPTRVVTAPPARTPSVRTQPPRVVAAPTTTVPTKPVVVERPPAVVAGAGCEGASALSQQYLNSNFAVRCGPQATHPGNFATRSGGNAPTTTTVVVRPGPEIAPPPGYKPAFEDDRFNPNRGQQTRTGFAQMRLVWTAGVPRRLIDQNSGRDVTGQFPGLRFPFINLQHQQQYVARHGWPAGSDRPNSGGGSVAVSTKNTPATAPVVTAPPRSTAPAGHRYVQVGTFGVQSNARNTAARLQQLGLPVRLGTYQRSGKNYTVVLAGPFNSGNALGSALSTARRAGFSDAFTRK